MGGQLATAISNAGAIYKEVVVEALYRDLTGSKDHPQIHSKRYVDDKKARFLINSMVDRGVEFLFTHEFLYGKGCPLVTDDILIDNNNQCKYDFVGTKTTINNGLMHVVPNIKESYNWTHGRCARSSSEKVGFIMGKLSQVKQFSNRLGWKMSGEHLVQNIINDFIGLSYKKEFCRKALTRFCTSVGFDGSNINI